MRLRLVRLLLVATVTSTVFAVSTPTVGACSCLASTEQESFDRADVVFEGVVLTYEHLTDTLALTTFDVTDVYKGSARETQLVYSGPDESACGLEFVEGLAYVMFAIIIDGSEANPGYPIGDLRSDFCSGVRRAGSLGLDLDPPVEPVAPIANAPTTTTTLTRPTTGAEELTEPLDGGTFFVVGFIAVGIIGAFVASRIAKKSRDP